MTEIYNSWRIIWPLLLGPVLNQLGDVCWALSLTRQLEAVLRLYDPNFPDDGVLSIQELINLVPYSEMDPDGSILSLGTAIAYLYQPGLVLAEHCPLTYELNATMDYDVDNPPARFTLRYIRPYDMWEDYEGNGKKIEEDIVKLLAYSPVTVTIPSLPSYCNFVPAYENEVYVPSHEDLYQADETDITDDCMLHIPLCTGSGVDPNGIPYLEVQESAGDDIGDEGFFRIARGYGLFLRYVDMRF